jgi:energy-converting hydrogenase Eha subunit B
MCPPGAEAGVSLEPTRAGAYLCGALAGGLTAAALVAVRDRDARGALASLGSAVVCGAAAVALEEWTRIQQAAQSQ